MKKNKILFMMIAGAMLTAGCSDDQVAETAANGRVPIELGYTLQQAQVTRSITDNINDKYIAPGGQVHVTITNHTTPTDEIYNGSYYVVESGTATINTVANTHISKMAPMDGVPYYPIDGSKVDIKAYYPARAASGTFIIMTDQSTDEGYAASDLMWATPVTNQGISDNPVNLNFNHKLAKIVININKKTGVTAVTSVRMMQVKPTVTFNTSDGTTGTASGTETTITVAKGTDVSKCAVIIPAQTIAGTLLQVVTDGGTATFNVASQTFAANHRYTTTIDVGASNIDLTNTITAWDDEDFSAVKSYTAKSLGELTNLINSGGAYANYLGWYVKADGTISSSDASAIGRIAYMNNSDVDVDVPGSRILVVAVADLGTYAWKNAQSGGESDWNLQSAYNGYSFAVNHNNSTTYPAAYTAFNWVTSRPSGATKWFMPSRGQLSAMLTVMKMEGTGQITSGRYWTATESDVLDVSAIAYNIDNSGWASDRKNNTYNVRACFAYPSVYASITTKHLGWILTSEGYIYPHVKEAEASHHTPVAMIAYVGPNTGEAEPYNHGLAISLADASGGNMVVERNNQYGGYWYYWKTSATTNDNTVVTINGIESGYNNSKGRTDETIWPAFAAAANNNGAVVPPMTLGWFIGSHGQWDQMISSGTGFGDVPTFFYAFSQHGVFKENYFGYWTSTESTYNTYVDTFNFDPNGIIWYGTERYREGEPGGRRVRAFLAF